MLRQLVPDILQNAFDSSPKTEAGAIDLTKATRMSEGSTHVLYRFPDSPLVIKVMKQNPTIEELDELEKKYADLYDCFDKGGKQRCIREYHLTHPVLLPGKESHNAALSLVAYEKCFKEAEVQFDFKIEPAELDPYIVKRHQELFVATNETLINGNNNAPAFDLNKYNQLDERMGAILQRLEGDSGLKDTMSEFLTHYREFYQRRNIILDAMGKENILFFKDEAGDWQFKMGSVIKHDTGKFTKELFNTIHSGAEIDLNVVFNFTHAYLSPANIRAVNVCAMKLKLEPIITDVSIDPKDLFLMAKKLPIPERMLAYAQHGDFEKVNKILLKHRHQLTFDFRSYWAYSKIADEYTKHGQPLLALKSYLDTVSSFPITLPETRDHAKIVEDSKTTIIAQKNKLYAELGLSPRQEAHSRSHASTDAMLMERGIADKSPSPIIKPEEVVQPKHSEKIDVQPRDGAEQVQLEKKETSTRPPTPFGSINAGPKPKGFDEKK